MYHKEAPDLVRRVASTEENVTSTLMCSAFRSRRCFVERADKGEGRGGGLLDFYDAGLAFGPVGH